MIDAINTDLLYLDNYSTTLTVYNISYILNSEKSNVKLNSVGI